MANIRKVDTYEERYYVDTNDDSPLSVPLQSFEGDSKAQLLFSRVGYRTTLLQDGKPVDGVIKVTIELSATDFAVVRVERIRFDENGIPVILDIQTGGCASGSIDEVQIE